MFFLTTAIAKIELYRNQRLLVAILLKRTLFHTAWKVSLFRVILVRIFPAFSRIRTEYGEILRISPYSVLMRENAGKVRTRITPNTETFYTVPGKMNCIIF